MRTLAAFLVIAGVAQGQDKPAPDHEELTPEKAMEMLKEVQELMARSEELLHDSSRGKAMETEEAILKRIHELLKDDPSVAQKMTIEKIEKLMEKSQGSQKDAIERMAEVIRKVKAQGGGSGPDGSQPKLGQKPVQNPGSPAPAPYDPNRTGDAINRFRSRGDMGRWGDLPARLREAILSGKRSIDDFPPEFQQVLKEYFKAMTGEDK
jgi:hypothetical protein